MPWYLISRLLYVSLGIYHWQHKMSFSAIFCLPIAGGQLKTFSKFLKNLFSKFIIGCFIGNISMVMYM